MGAGCALHIDCMLGTDAARLTFPDGIQLRVEEHVGY